MPWYYTLAAHGTISALATVADWYWSGEDCRFKRSMWICRRNEKRQLWTIFGLEMLQNGIYIFTGSPMWRSEALLTALEIPVDFVGVKIGEGIVYVLERWIGLSPKGGKAGKRVKAVIVEPKSDREKLKPEGPTPLEAREAEKLEPAREKEDLADQIAGRMASEKKKAGVLEPVRTVKGERTDALAGQERVDYRKKGEEYGAHVVDTVQGFFSGIGSRLRRKKKARKEDETRSADEILKELDKH